MDGTGQWLACSFETELGARHDVPIPLVAASFGINGTPWYHCVTRCVRRAFLCGEDRLTGRSCEHRRAWFADRIKELAGIFAIDMAGCAAMSNRVHLFVRIDRDRALGWSVEEVLERWTALFAGPLPVKRWLSEQRSAMTAVQIETFPRRPRYIGHGCTTCLGSCAH